MMSPEELHRRSKRYKRHRWKTREPYHWIIVLILIIIASTCTLYTCQVPLA